MTTLGIVLISYLYPSIRSLQIAVRSRSFMPEKVSSLATPPSNPVEDTGFVHLRLIGIAIEGDDDECSPCVW